MCRDFGVNDGAQFVARVVKDSRLLSRSRSRSK
jgi:hypothetical protein